MVGERLRNIYDRLRSLGVDEQTAYSKAIGDLMITNLRVAIQTLNGHLEDYKQTHLVHYFFIMGYGQGQALAFYEERYNLIQDRAQREEYEHLFNGVFRPLHRECMALQDRFMNNGVKVWPPQ